MFKKLKELLISSKPTIEDSLCDKDGWGQNKGGVL